MKHSVNLVASSFILSNYMHLLNGNNESVEKIGSEELMIPTFSEELLINLCNSAINILKQKNQTLINIPFPAIVIGDLHGNLHDLIRITNCIDDIFNNNILFLGDYVDRGQYQVETITLLLALRIEYPDNFFLIRGNHEFTNVNSSGGFKDEILNSGYSEALFDKFNEAFYYLPIAATISDQIFCVHGGLSPQFQKISQIETDFKLPIRKISAATQKKKNHRLSDSAGFQPQSPHQKPINFPNKKYRYSDSIELKTVAMNIPIVRSPVESKMQPFMASKKLSHERKSNSYVYSKLPMLSPPTSPPTSPKQTDAIIPVPPRKPSGIPPLMVNSPPRPNFAIPIPPARSNSNLTKVSPLKVNLCPQSFSARISSENQIEEDDSEDDGNNVGLLTDLLWSDPSNLTDFFLPSNRGSGFYFGFIATSSFLQKNEMKLIVRGHESIKKGVELNHEKKIMTVYSSSSMSQGGLAGCVVFDSAFDYKVYKLEPIEVIQRSEAKFFTPTLKHCHKIESLTVNSFKRKSIKGKMRKMMSEPKHLNGSFDAIENNVH